MSLSQIQSKANKQDIKTHTVIHFNAPSTVFERQAVLIDENDKILDQNTSSTNFENKQIINRDDRSSPMVVKPKTAENGANQLSAEKNKGISTSQPKTKSTKPRTAVDEKQDSKPLKKIGGKKSVRIDDNVVAISAVNSSEFDESVDNIPILSKTKDNSNENVSKKTDGKGKKKKTGMKNENDHGETEKLLNAEKTVEKSQSEKKSPGIETDSQEQTTFKVIEKNQTKAQVAAPSKHSGFGVGAFVVLAAAKFIIRLRKQKAKREKNAAAKNIKTVNIAQETLPARKKHRHRHHRHDHHSHDYSKKYQSNECNSPDCSAEQEKKEKLKWKEWEKKIENDLRRLRYEKSSYTDSESKISSNSCESDSISVSDIESDDNIRKMTHRKYLRSPTRFDSPPRDFRKHSKQKYKGARREAEKFETKRERNYYDFNYPESSAVTDEEYFNDPDFYNFSNPSHCKVFPKQTHRRVKTDGSRHLYPPPFLNHPKVLHRYQRKLPPVIYPRDVNNFPQDYKYVPYPNIDLDSRWSPRRSDFSFMYGNEEYEPNTSDYNSDSQIYYNPVNKYIRRQTPRTRIKEIYPPEYFPNYNEDEDDIYNESGYKFNRYHGKLPRKNVTVNDEEYESEYLRMYDQPVHSEPRKLGRKFQESIETKQPETNESETNNQTDISNKNSPVVSEAEENSEEKAETMYRSESLKELNFANEISEKVLAEMEQTFTSEPEKTRKPTYRERIRGARSVIDTGLRNAKTTDGRVLNSLPKTLKDTPQKIPWKTNGSVNIRDTGKVVKNAPLKFTGKKLLPLKRSDTDNRIGVAANKGIQTSRQTSFKDAVHQLENDSQKSKSTLDSQRLEDKQLRNTLNVAPEEPIQKSQQTQQSRPVQLVFQPQDANLQQFLSPSIQDSNNHTQPYGLLQPFYNQPQFYQLPANPNALNLPPQLLFPQYTPYIQSQNQLQLHQQPNQTYTTVGSMTNDLVPASVNVENVPVLVIAKALVVEPIQTQNSGSFVLKNAFIHKS